MQAGRGWRSLTGRSIQLFAHLGASVDLYTETEMVLWSFPNDRKLTHLPELLNLEFLAAHLPSKLALLGVMTLVR